MNKKVLQIQTNFLQEEEPHSPTVTTSKINYQDKLSAATILEKILSIILTKNFIHCWDTLKQYDLNMQQVYKPIKNNNIYNINNRYNKNQPIIRETQQRVRYFQTNQESIQKPRSRSYITRLHRLHTQQLTDQEPITKRNKSARMINQQIQHSRASILQEIVQKLKNIRKVNETQENSNNQTNEEVLKKITYLERTLRNMKNQRIQNRYPDYETTENNQNFHKNKNIHYRQNIHIRDKSVQSSQEDEQLMKTFLAQIEQIKKQIGQIKSNNQAILKSQLERSRASSASARYHNRHRDNNYFIPVQMMPPYMSFNPNYIPMHNTASPVPTSNTNQNHQNSMHYKNIQQTKYKVEQKISQSRTRQQTNPHTQTSSQAPTQAQLQNINNLNGYVNTQVKKTISEGVQTNSVQKNTIYTQTEDTKYKNSLKKYNEQLDQISSRKPLNNIYQKPKSKQPYQGFQEDHYSKYKRPYTTEPKRQIDLKYQNPYQFSFKDTDVQKNRNHRTLPNQQTYIQPKLKFPQLPSNSITSSNNYREGQYDIYNKPREKLYHSSASNSNQNSQLHYNIPVAQIALLMKKIQKINQYVQNQNKIKHEKEYQFSNKPKFQENNHVPVYTPEVRYEFRNNSLPTQPIQPIQGPQQIHTYLPRPSSIPQTQILKIQQPIHQFRPNQSQISVPAPPPPPPSPQPPVYYKPQTHSVSQKMPQQIQTKPITITRPLNDYPRADQIKSNGTFYSKNNVYSEIDSSYSFGFPIQVNHYRKPSIQVYKDNNIRPNISFTNYYCSLCGRNCGCPRSFTTIPRN